MHAFGAGLVLVAAIRPSAMAAVNAAKSCSVWSA